MYVSTQIQKETKIFLQSGQHLRDIRVFQSQPAEVKHAHGCSTTNEDEKRDELPGKEIAQKSDCISLMKVLLLLLVHTL